jgi:hypothetical protein
MTETPIKPSQSPSEPSDCSLGHTDTTQAPKVAENPAPRSPDRTVCRKCGKDWGGLNTCHCSACHETFTGITAFDMHRAGSHAGNQRHCLPPAGVGLVDAERKYPCWGRPGSPPEDSWG